MTDVNDLIRARLRDITNLDVRRRVPALDELNALLLPRGVQVGLIFMLDSPAIFMIRLWSSGSVPIELAHMASWIVERNLDCSWHLKKNRFGTQKNNITWEQVCLMVNGALGPEYYRATS